MPANPAILVRGSEKERAAREVMYEHFKQSPIPGDQMLMNIGLYVRSTILAKVLYLNELYEHVLPIPGIIAEFGVWWGANIALLNNFRAVYEPYNWTRKIVGFDTFTGYQSKTEKDGDSVYTAEGGYATSKEYEPYLQAMLKCHEQDNMMAHIQKFELVPGDVMNTVGRYFNDHPEAIVALAYFDLGLYAPTKACLEAIKPRLVRGSVLAMDELNCAEFPGETIALAEVIGLDRYKIYRSKFFPDRSYLIVD